MKKIFLIILIYFVQSNLLAKTCDFEWSVYQNEKYAKFTFKNNSEYIAKITVIKIFTEDKKEMIEKKFISVRSGKIIPRYIQPFSTSTYEYGNINLMWNLASSATIFCKALNKYEYEKELKKIKDKQKGKTVQDLLDEQNKKSDSKSLLKKLLKK